MKSILYKIFGSKNDRTLKLIDPLIRSINGLESSISPLSDNQLAAKTAEFKTRVGNGEQLDAILPEAFAVVREAAKRVLGMRHFDTQLIGGVVLHQGKIAEMKTGEGKTLVATLPSYLNALTGNGVHIVTVNDYLAKRDADWMGRIHRFLGLEVGCIIPNIDPETRANAYKADITYGQNNEFGFDYLRDNMKVSLTDMVQRGHAFAIVDEVDSILIDEARVPLIISGPSEGGGDLYQASDQIVRNLRADEHYTIDIKDKQVGLTEEGVQHIEKMVGVENLYEPRNIRLVHHVNQALRAHVIMKRDVDYVVRNSQIMIVDEFTGRLMDGRRWSDGLHQAIEAKEGVPVLPENQTLATVTFQNYFRMYKKLSGMTGTADTEAVEFKKIYNLDVVLVPTNRPMVRKDSADIVYVSEKAKFHAVCDEIEQLVKKGQPVLVGTASIAKSEQLSELLEKRGVPHHVLNAKQHEKEAEIVAQAGRLGAVTISTNMAGRGTDILLGGNAEFLAARAAGTKDPENADYQRHLEKFREVCHDERDKVVAAGGLHILGTERHESRRIDNQLRGRSGRQGDPGSSRFYISLEDDLMKRFGGVALKNLMARLGALEDDAIESRMVSSSIERAQKKVEGIHFAVRKHVLEYDDVLNRQRELNYRQRDQILRGEAPPIEEMFGDVIEEIVLSRVDEKASPSSWDVEGIVTAISQQFALQLDPAEYVKRAEHSGSSFAQEIYDDFLAKVNARHQELLDERYKVIPEEEHEQLKRIFLLQVLDNLWKEHLTNMEYLREGTRLRTYAQKNPLHEYQREGFELFSALQNALKGLFLNLYFRIVVNTPEQAAALEQAQIEAMQKAQKRAKESHGVESVFEPEEGEDGAPQNRATRRQDQRDQGRKAAKT